MDKSSAPEPPRIAPNVRIETLIAPLFASVYVTLAWNFLVAPSTGVDTISFFAVLGGAIIWHSLASVAGYAAGHGLARQDIAENETYGTAAAEFLEAVDAEQRAALAAELEQPESRQEQVRRGGGGQG